MHSTDKADLMLRSETYAGWTLPSIFPPEYVNSSTEIQNDYQALGARAVNHLANKLNFVLFNPNRPFFRLRVDDAYMQELEAKGLDSSTIESVFSAKEQEAIGSMAKRRTRTSLVMLMKHLIITGNALLYTPEDKGNTQVYSLRDYVVKRSPDGTPLVVITRDLKNKAQLPEDVQALITGKEDDEHVTLYTAVKLRDGKYELSQEADSVTLSSSGSWTKDELPWIPLTWNLLRGQHYGVGLVEEYAGAFNTVSILTESLVRAGVISADIKFLVDPAGATDYDALNNAASGEYVSGRVGDIGSLQLSKESDLAWVMNLLDATERNIAQAFLLNSAVTRDAERVNIMALYKLP